MNLPNKSTLLAKYEMIYPVIVQRKPNSQEVKDVSYFINNYAVETIFDLEAKKFEFKSDPVSPEIESFLAPHLRRITRLFCVVLTKDNTSVYGVSTLSGNTYDVVRAQILFGIVREATLYYYSKGYTSIGPLAVTIDFLLDLLTDGIMQMISNLDPTTRRREAEYAK